MKYSVAKAVLFIALCLPALPVLAGQAVSNHAAGAQHAVGKEQLQQMQDRIMNDQKTMAMISALQSDPEIMVLLNDPSFVQAIMSMNMEALANDPRFINLFNKPQMKEIIRQLEQQ